MFTAEFVAPINDGHVSQRYLSRRFEIPFAPSPGMEWCGLIPTMNEPIDSVRTACCLKTSVFCVFLDEIYLDEFETIQEICEFFGPDWAMRELEPGENGGAPV